MKKWLLALLILAIMGYFAHPYIFNAAGIHFGIIHIYNGSNRTANYEFNGNTLTLKPYKSKIYQTHRFSNKIVYKDGSNRFVATFGKGQHIVNIGKETLFIEEKYFPWDETNNKFYGYFAPQLDKELFNTRIEQGLVKIDDCIDCCIIIPPKTQPTRYLIPENRYQRFFKLTQMSKYKK